MNENKTDRRILRTIKMIDEAMMELLERKPISVIGVTELCGQADINRNTFYCHYNTPVDVLRHLEERMLKEIGTALSAEADSVEATETALRVMRENERLCRILFSDHTDGSFSKRVFELSTSRNLSIAAREASRLSHSYQVMLSDFANAGGSAIVKRWATNGMKEPPEDIAKFIREVSNHGSASVQQNPAPEFR